MTLPCRTRYAGMPLALPCDQCSHVLAMHRGTDLVCSACEAAEVLMLGQASLVTDVAALRLELAGFGAVLANVEGAAHALCDAVEAVELYVGTEEHTAGDESITGRVLRLEQKGNA